MASKTEHLAPYTDFRWSRLDYENLSASGILTPEDRVELLDGRIITMSPQQTSHATATRLLRAFLAEAYSPDQFVVDTQLPLALDANSEPEPDLMVARGKVSDFTDHHPTPAEVILVVEVADSSLDYDRGAKRRAYARAGIREYWILNLIARVAEIHRSPSGESYTDCATLGPEDQLQPPGGSKSAAVEAVLPRLG